MAASPKTRSKTRDRNIFLALGVAALIVIAVIYYEAPAVLSKSTSSATGSSSSYGYPTEYGNTFNCACSADPALTATDAPALSENSINSYPYQATPFLAGGLSLQVGLDGLSFVANVGNYEMNAVNIENQLPVWSAPLPNSPLNLLPYVTPFFHLEATTTIGGQAEVWSSTPWDGIYGFAAGSAVNANYGFNETVPAEGQDGNIGTYSWAAPNFAIDEPRSIMVTGPSVNTTGIPGRGLVEGWKIGTKNATLSFSQTQFKVTSATQLWTTYLSPPQDGSDPGWELSTVNSIPHVWEFNGTSALDLKTLPSSQLQSVLANDWTPQSGNATYSTGPESNSSWIADTATDTTYIVTSAPQTVSATSSFNGPALFSSSIIALSTTTGSILWTFQVTPHDVWGWGCKGNIALVQATVAGTSQQVIAKQCENGYLFLLNPTTGALLYSGQIPTVVRAPGAQIPNVLNQTAMKETLASVTGISGAAHPVQVNNANLAYDQTNALLLGAIAPQSNNLGGQAPLPTSWNSTAYAFDLTKLVFAWQAPVTNQQFSYILVANGIAYLGTYEGSIYVATTSTGSNLALIHAVQAVTSIMVMSGQHGQSGLIVAGHSTQTKQVVETELYTVNGASIV